MSESEDNIKNYFKELQNKLNDLRDNRGKRHNFSFVILSFFIALLRSSRNLNYSVIHRSMQRDSKYLKELIGEKSASSISYSQLKRILLSVYYQLFNNTNQNYFSEKILGRALEWQAVDGKELRGTIDKIGVQK